MFNKKWLMMIIMIIFAFTSNITGLSQYKYTEQSGTGYFVSEADHADALENQNELRMILDELGLLLEHSKYGDASYPADENTTPGTLDIFDDYYTKLEIDALGYISDITAESIGDLSDVDLTDIADTKILQYNATTSKWECETAPAGGGASELSDLSDVNTSTPTNRYVLVADGVDFESRLLVEADISDLGTYLENITAESILDLTDTPVAFDSGKFLKSGADAVTFASITETDITDLGSYIENVVEDTTPELGGELDAGAHSIGFTLQTVAEADGTTTIDWKLGNHCKVTLGAQNETFTFTAPSNPCTLTLIIIQDATGGRDITWPGTVKWLGTEATWTDGGAGKGIVVGFIYDGTNYWGQATPWES